MRGIRRGRFRSWCWRGVFLAASTIPSACLDLVPVAPPPSQPAVLYLTLQMGEAVAENAEGPSLVRVTATLVPGVDGHGRLISPSKDTLWIAGVGLTPIEREHGGVRVYSSALYMTIEELFASAIVIGPPPIHEGGLRQVAVQWPLFRREGPAMVTVATGADLVLGVNVNQPGTSPQPTFHRWSISLFHAGGWASIGEDAPLPAQIVVPAQLIGPQGGPRLALLNSSQSGEIPLIAGQYVMRLETTQSTRWTVNAPRAETLGTPIDHHPRRAVPIGGRGPTLLPEKHQVSTP